ncbi:MAG: hypothetical protein EA381_19715 [Planctomycetaceae bacterium]|nr:MAG: hypothetical protein EA381_19715 [Planctomycetaceae bacterium]
MQSQLNDGAKIGLWPTGYCRRQLAIGREVMVSHHQHLVEPGRDERRTPNAERRTPRRYGTHDPASTS